MKITTRPATTQQIPAQSGVIRDDWATTPGGYSFTDTGTEVIVIITPKAGTHAIVANPNATPPVVAAAAVPATIAFQFVLYAPGQAYAAANALNNGAGYGNVDLVRDITAHLAALVAAGA